MVQSLARCEFRMRSTRTNSTVAGWVMCACALQAVGVVLAAAVGAALGVLLSHDVMHPLETAAGALQLYLHRMHGLEAEGMWDQILLTSRAFSVAG